MWRTTLNMAKFHPSVMTDLWNQVKSSFGEEVKEREATIENTIKARDTQIKLKILYGNTHKKLEEYSTTEDGFENKHWWWAYVELEDELKDHIFIKKVIFELDETFEETLITRNRPPYEYIWRGWGELDIPITIEWQKWLNKDNTVINHHVSFERNGSNKEFIITVDKDQFLKKYPNSKTDLVVKKILSDQKKRVLF